MYHNFRTFLSSADHEAPTMILSQAYIYIYIYIRTSPGTRDISIVASSACRGNNSAPTHYTGPRVVVDWTENRARIPDLLSFSFQSRPSLFPPSFSFRRVPTKGNRQVFNYPDKIGEDGPRFCPF